MEPWQLLASLCMVHDSSCCNEQGPNKGFRVCKTKMGASAPIDVQCAPVTPIPMKVSLPYLAG